MRKGSNLEGAVPCVPKPWAVAVLVVALVAAASVALMAIGQREGAQPQDGKQAEGQAMGDEAQPQDGQQEATQDEGEGSSATSPGMARPSPSVYDPEGYLDGLSADDRAAMGDALSAFLEREGFDPTAVALAATAPPTSFRTHEDDPVQVAVTLYVPGLDRTLGVSGFSGDPTWTGYWVADQSLEDDAAHGDVALDDQEALALSVGVDAAAAFPQAWSDWATSQGLPEGSAFVSGALRRGTDGVAVTVGHTHAAGDHMGEETDWYEATWDGTSWTFSRTQA